MYVLEYACFVPLILGYARVYYYVVTTFSTRVDSFVPVIVETGRRISNQAREFLNTLMPPPSAERRAQDYPREHWTRDRKQTGSERCFDPPPQLVRGWR